MLSPRNTIDDRRMLLDRVTERLVAAARRTVSTRREKFAGQAAALDALSPLKVLGRGYAIARDAEKHVIRSAKDVKPGDKITVRLKKDELSCIVDKETTS
jgi:exodeoxyribonuclease VII large subunit